MNRSFFLFALPIIASSFFFSGCQAPLKNKGVAYLPDYSESSQSDLLFRQNGAGNRLSYESIFFISDLPSKINKNEHNNAWLGVSLTDKEINASEKTGKKHLLIRYVLRNSPAENFGLKNGDVILKLNGEIIPLSTGISPSEYFVKKLRQHSPASKVTLTILRDNSEHEIIVELGTRPKAPVIMAQHKNISSSVRAGESILEKTLKKRKMLSGYNEVANRVKRKSADVISYRFDPANLNPFRLTEVNYLLNHPLNVPQVTQELTGQIKKYFSSDVKNISGLLNYTAKKIDMDYSPDGSIAFPQNLTLDALIEYIEQVFQRALSLREEAFAMLSEGEMNFLYSYSETYLPQTTEITDEETDEEITEEEEQELLRFFNLSLKVDYKKLFASTQLLLQAFDLNTIEKLKQLARSMGKPPAVGFEGVSVAIDDVILRKKTKAGWIVIGGTGQNIYREESAIIIDLGGDDIYYNNAGSSSKNSPISLLIDLSGNDKYISSQPFAQGSGLLGTGILIDLSGDDLYSAGDISQGVGIIGIGLLVDFEGDDRFFGKSSVQGLGLLGIGLILEGGGNDRYLAERYAQGVGFTKGFGGIIEAGGSDYMFAGGKYPDFRDPENATESYSQGFGFGFRPYKTSVGTSGGMGLVYDQEGNDTYVVDYFGQGASYWYAFGALVDEAGNDTYISGRYSQGAGIHISIGTLIDKKGDDHYISTFGVGQGCGHDFGIGVLVDNLGNDFYKGGVLVQGFGNETGIGIMYDNKGNDTYVSEGPGAGNYSSLHEAGSIGLYVDAEGEDNYFSGEKNHSSLSRNGWGLFWDI